LYNVADRRGSCVSKLSFNWLYHITFSLLRSRFIPRIVDDGFMVDEVVLWQIFVLAGSLCFAKYHFTSAALLSLIIGLLHRLTTWSTIGLKLLTTCKTNNWGHIHFLTLSVAVRNQFAVVTYSCWFKREVGMTPKSLSYIVFIRFSVKI